MYKRQVFSLLYQGEILNKPLREVAFDFLSRCRSTDALQRYIPDAVTVLHKMCIRDRANTPTVSCNMASAIL